jgi:tRNA modification GTPase
VVILGPPNTGKTSLFKALVPKSRALVSAMPGTTRDLLEGEVNWKDKKFLLYDAPGVSKSKDPLERLAVSRLNGMMARTDLALAVFDGSVPLPRENLVHVMQMIGVRSYLMVINKCDLPIHPQWDRFMEENNPLSVSSMKRIGLENLLYRLKDCLPQPSGEGGLGVDFQMVQIIQKTRSAIQEALLSDWEGGLELVAMSLREATDNLGRLAGRVTDEEVLNKVFSRFCIGK